VPAVNGRCSETTSLTVRSALGEVAVADQPDGAGADIAHRLAEIRVRRPAEALTGRAIQNRQPPHCGQHH